MNSTEKGMARVAGAVFCVLGLAIGIFSVFAIARLISFKGNIRAPGLYAFLGLLLLGIFCIATGYRLVFNRPNRYQSVLPPWGWYALALAFAALAAGTAFLVHGKGYPGKMAGNVWAIGFSALCFKAGRKAALRGIDAPLLPVEQPVGYLSPRGWQIGVVGNTAFFIHWSFLFGGLLISALSGFTLPDALYYCAMYTALIVVHELGHVAAAWMSRLRIDSVEISGLGGLCRIQAPRDVRIILVVYAAGLLAQLAVLALTLVCVAVFGPPVTPLAQCAFKTFVFVNLVLMILNIIPAKVHGGIANDGMVLWQSVLHLWKGQPAPFSDLFPKSPVFARETNLQQMEGFASADFTAGIEILNDDTTPMEFVVGVLVEHLQIDRETAIQMMLGIHGNGGLLFPIADRERRLAVAAAISAAAREHGHELVCRSVEAGELDRGV